jgi:hypothetical protein
MVGTIKNVVEKFQKTAMSIVLEDVAHHNWGWFSREDQRMHLQTVDPKSIEGKNKTRVWLENKGKRTFELSIGSISGSDLRKLKTEVEADRADIEVQWSILMISNQWVTAELNGSIVTLTAYPRSHNRFVRTIDLRHEAPGSYATQNSWADQKLFVDLDGNSCSIAVGPEKNMNARRHIRLDKILWVD